MNELISQMRYFAFAAIAIALMVESTHRDALFARRFIFILCLVAGIAFYNDIIDAGVSMFASAKANAQEEYLFTIKQVKEILDRAGRKASILWQIFYYLAAWGLGLCKVFAWISQIVQEALIVIYKVCCPIALGLAAFRAMGGVAVKFAIGTLWLCMWSIGTAIADLLIAKIAFAAFAKGVFSAGSSAAAGLIGGAAGVAAAPALLIGVLIGVTVLLVTMILLYILIPVSIYSLLSGGEIGQAAGNAMRTAILGGAAAGGAMASTFYRSGGGRKIENNKNNKKTDEKNGTDANSITSPGGSGTSASGGGTSGSGSASASTHAAMSDLADKQLAASKAMQKGA